MATDLALRFPDFEPQLVLTSDTSDVEVGALVEQDFGSGLHPITIMSPKLNGTQIPYSAYESEILGIV